MYSPNPDSFIDVKPPTPGTGGASFNDPRFEIRDKPLSFFGEFSMNVSAGSLLSQLKINISRSITN